jgi:hypothetical protein
MVLFTEFCSLGKSECEIVKGSGFSTSLNSSGQEEPNPKRFTAPVLPDLVRLSMSEGRSVHRM